MQEVLEADEADYQSRQRCQGYLGCAQTTTAWHMSQKAVVIDPPGLLGKVIWHSRSALLDSGWDERRDRWGSPVQRYY